MFEARLMLGLICEPGLNWLVTTLGRPGLTGAGWKMTTSDTESERGTGTGARAMEVMGPGRLATGDTIGLFGFRNILLG